MVLNGEMNGKNMVVWDVCKSHFFLYLFSFHLVVNHIRSNTYSPPLPCAPKQKFYLLQFLKECIKLFKYNYFSFYFVPDLVVDSYVNQGDAAFISKSNEMEQLHTKGNLIQKFLCQMIG